MKYALQIALSITTLAAAQYQDLPQCAIQCFNKAMSSTPCAPNDNHCTCTTGAKSFMKAAIPCLCEAGCSADDLKKVEVATNVLCSAALAAKGEAYSPATLDPKVCQAVETGVPGSMSMTMTSLMSGSGSATGTATATGSATGTGTSTATETAAAPSSTGGARGGFMVEGFVVGLAFLGLVLM